MNGADLRTDGRAHGRSRRLLAAGFLALWTAAALAGCSGGGGGGGGGGTAPTNDLPRAKFQPDRVTGFTGDSYRFDPQASSDPDGQIVRYAWDFQYDGQTFRVSFESATPDPVSTSYGFAGAYTVALRVTDDVGQTDVTTLRVFVADRSKTLQAIPDTLDFGTPEVGEAVDDVLYVFNSGNQAVDITSVSSNRSQVTPATLPARVTVNPDEAAPIPLEFLSFLTTPIAGTLSVLTDGPVDLSVGFSGTARSGFTRVGDMTVARKFHTATRLQDGRVLIVGGEDQNNTILDSAEFYDPDTHTFQAAPAMNTVTPEPGVPVIDGRSHHTATLLANGMVLVAGGVYQNDTSGAQEVHDTGLVFDPATDKWEYNFRLNTVIGQPRTQHVAVRLVTAGAEEQVVLVGGKGDVASADGLDTADVLTGSGAYIKTITLGEPRLLHGAVALDNARILVAGGQGTVDGATDGAEVIDIGTGTSTPLTLNVARYELTLTPVDPGGGGATGWLAVGGGHLGLGARGVIESYEDGAGGGFSLQAARLKAPRRRHASVDLGNGRGLLVVGGIDASNLAVDRAEIVDPGGGTVETLSDRLNVARGNGHRATLLDDGSVLITGGIAPGQGGAVSAAELYVPEP
jgi:hypothetical protein